MSEEEIELEIELSIEQLKKWRDFIIENKDKVNKANLIEFYLTTVLNYIDKLQKELEQERKLTNLIIDDFQAENYFINMTNNEVRKYYSKRKELK